MDKVFINLINLSSGFAYASIFGILVACGLGLPLPEDIPLIAAGYLCWEGTMKWIPALITTLTGVLIGDTVLFFIGRKLGPAIIEGNAAQTFFSYEKIRRTKAYFRKYGYKIVFFARFVAGIRAVVFFSAGAMKMRYQKFILLDAIAALISVPFWIGLGHFLGAKWGDEIETLLRKVKHLKTSFTIFIIVITLIVILRAIVKFRKSKTLNT